MSNYFHSRIRKIGIAILAMCLCISLVACSSQKGLVLSVPKSLKNTQTIANQAFQISANQFISNYGKMLNTNFKKGYQYQDKHQNGNAVFRCHQYQMSAVLTFYHGTNKLKDFSQKPSGVKLMIMYPAYDSSMLNHAKIMTASFWICLYPSMNPKEIRFPKLYTNPDDFHDNTYTSLYSYKDLGFYNQTYALGNNIVWSITAAKNNISQFEPITTTQKS